MNEEEAVMTAEVSAGTACPEHPCPDRECLPEAPEEPEVPEAPEVSEAPEAPEAAPLPAVAPERFAELAAFVGETLREQQTLLEHFGRLRSQAEAMAKEYPSFRLADAIGNETFVRLTSPEVGLSVEDAWWLVNRRELTEQAARRAAEETEQRLSNALQAGKNRPVENGTGGPPGTARFDYAAMSPRQREEFIEYARRASARGEKVYLY